MAPELLTKWITGTIRHVLGSFFAAMVGKGIVTGAEAENTLLWLSGVVVMWLWSLYEKWRARKSDNTPRQPNGTSFSLLLLCSLMIVGLSVGACKKAVKIEGESQATYKKRLTAIYAGKTIVGIGGTNQGVRLLADNDVFDKPVAARLTEILKRVGIAWKVVTERLQSGFADAQTTQKLQDIIADIEKLERDQAITFKSDQARQYFFSITGGAKTSLAALQALLGGPGKPTPDLSTFEAKATQARVQLAWVFDLSTLAFNVVNRMNQFSFFTTAEDAYAAAFAEQVTVVVAIEKNLADYKQ